MEVNLAKYVSNLIHRYFTSKYGKLEFAQVW